MTPQLTKVNIMEEQRQIQRELLIAVLIIEDNNREEQWLNWGALVYDLRAPDTRHKLCPSLIGTMATDTRTATILSCYEDITLNGVGMRMELIGPGDMTRMQEICEGIGAENNIDGDARSNQIQNRTDT